MKYMLIALYLANGSVTPTMQTDILPSLKNCKRVQAMWMKQAVTGKKWGICTKLEV